MSPSQKLSSLLVLGVCAMAAGPLGAQVLITQNRVRLNYAEVEVRGDFVFSKKKLAEGGFAEVGIPIASIVAVEWPVPPELAAAEAELDQGSPLAALPALKRQARLLAPFLKAEGSPWLQAQVALVRAYARAGLPLEAEREFTVLKTAKVAEETLAGLQLDITLAQAHAGEWNAFAPKLAELRAAGLSETDSARLWLAQAEHDRRRGQPEKALYAFLQVTVFHPRAEDQQPRALLGAIRCLRALGDAEQAGVLTEELGRRFAESPEAATAAREVPST
ncbi:MAG TPA: hypothetical protein VIO38_03060 [Rariglobus sp.]